MNTTRNIAIMAAVVGMTAAIALAGVPTAHAGDLSAAPPASSDTTATTTQNELDQLRANQQLLQQRLDQLEQIAQVGTAKPTLPPGTASLAGSFPRSFLIPGTDTSISIGGRVIFDATEWFHGGNPNIANSSTSSGYGNATISGLPINGTAASKRSEDVFYEDVQNSRFDIETRTPTAFGEARTYIELDFADCTAGGGAGGNDCSNLTTFVNPLIPRLRLAYATLGPWMFGQNWGIGTDLAAAPESFDSTGIVGMWGTGRVPEASYTWHFPSMLGATSLEVGLVMPESTMGTPDGEIANDTAATGLTAVVGCTNCDKGLSENPLKNEWPAPAFALTFNQPWGHLQLHGALHEIYLDDGLGLNRSFLGGGGGASGSFNLPALGAKDNLGWSAHAGQGDFQFNGDGSPGDYFPSLVSNFGGPGAGCYGAAAAIPGVIGACVPAPGVATSPSSVIVQVPTNWGVDVNYQHWWTPTVRSTINYGYQYEDLNAALLGVTGPAGEGNFYNKYETLALANLIWSPVPFVDTGFEFFYGNRGTLGGKFGQALGLDYTFVMKF